MQTADPKPLALVWTLDGVDLIAAWEAEQAAADEADRLAAMSDSDRASALAVLS